MQLRKRKPVDYSDDHALFSKFLAETEDSGSSDSTNFSMGNAIARGKCKADTEAVSEGDAETAPARSWGSFHLRSVLGGRKGQNSNQDGGGRITGSGRLAEMTTWERVDALVRGAGFSDVAMPSGENPDSESDFEDVIRVPLLSVQEGNRKRKVKDLERVREWEHSSRSLGSKEAHSCISLHSMRDDNSTRPAVPRSAPTVSYQRTLCYEEGCQLLSYKVQLNVKERPASTSLDRLLEELSSVNVANSSGPDDRIAMETTDNELLSTYCVDVEEKPSLNSVQEGRASVPDLNKCFIPSVEGQTAPGVSSCHTKELRRNRRESHLKLKLDSERMTSAGLLEHHQSLNYQSMIKRGTQKVEGKATNSGCDGELKPEEKLLQFGLGENQSQELPVNVDSNQPSLVRRIGRVEKILSVKNRDAGSDAVFRVKESLRSYRQVVFVQGSVLQRHCPQLLRSFLKRMDQLGRRDGHTLEDTETPDFDPLYTRIDRIIAAEQRGSKKCYLVKWCGLPYTEATWEREENLRRDVASICRYHKNSLRISAIRRTETSSQGVFKDGRSLRDYQEAGVAWLDHNFKNRTNCILADEMGLGKTIQSVAMLENLCTKRRIRGPFLVVAPVSTLCHWQREIESLTDMNCVVYTGNQEDRQIIRNHEFYYSDGNSCELKFNVLLTSFEILMKDQNRLARETWQYIIVDEAHRLKSRDSKAAQSLRQLQVRHGGLLLLTGTPVQNNTKEMFSLLNLLDQNEFDSEEDFLRKYGDMKAAEQIKDLQDSILRPMLLRRMKEDVEKSIPLKEEMRSNLLADYRLG